MRRVTAKVLVWLAVVGIWSASAWGAGAQQNADVQAWAAAVREQYQGVTLTGAFGSHPSTDAMRAMVSEFTRLTGISVRWDVMEEGVLRNKILLEHEAGTGTYDLLMTDAFELAQYVPAGALLPLNDLLHDPSMTPSWFDYEDILPAYRDGIGTLDGTIYGIPIAGESRFVAYRTDLFEEYGKEPPRTMDELLELARFFNGVEPGLYGIAMRAQKGIHFASGFLQTMYSQGGLILDEATEEIRIDAPATIDALAYHVELLRQGPPDIGNYTHEEALSAFTLGRAAIWFDATALSSLILDPQSSLVYDRVAFIAPPAGSAGDYAAIAGWNISLSSDIPAERRGAAWAFVVWMTSRLNAKTYVGNGGVPTRASVYQDPELRAANPSYPAQLAALEKADNLISDGIHWLAPHPRFLQLLEIVGNLGSQALQGVRTPESAMRQAAAEARAMMGR